MALSTRNRAILAALEATYGTGPAAPGDYVALLVVDADLPSLQAQQAERNILQPHLGSRPAQPWQERLPLSWGHEAVGSGNVAEAPHFDAIIRASGWAVSTLSGTDTIATAPVAVGTPTGSWTYTRTTAYEGANRRRVTITCTTGGASGTATATIAAPATGLGATAETAYEVTGVTITDDTPIDLPGSAQVTPTVGDDWEVGDQWVVELVPPGIEYRPVSDRAVHKSAAIRYSLEGTRYQALGGRFQLSANFAVGGWPLLNFRGVGLYSAPTSEALPATDFSGVREPEVLDTHAFQLLVGPTDLSAAEWAPVGQSYSLTGGSDVRSKSRTGLDNVEVVDHAMTGELLVETPDIDIVDVAGMVNTRRRIRTVVGTRLGERCEIIHPTAQITGYTTRDDSGDAMTALPFRALSPTGAGDDETVIRFF